VKARGDIPPERVSEARSLAKTGWITGALPPAWVVQAFEQGSAHRPNDTTRLGGERYGSRPIERLREPGEHHKVGVQPHALKPAHAERREP
jgi:hypothetical protein